MRPVLLVLFVSISIALLALLLVRKQTREGFAQKAAAGYNTRDIYRVPCPDINYQRAHKEAMRIANRRERKKALSNLQKQCSFETTLERLDAILDDRMDLFTMHSCVSSTRDQLTTEIARMAPKADYPIVALPVFSAATFQAVRVRILAELRKAADRTKEKLLYSPAYALIYQTPHMRSPLDPSRTVAYMNQNAKGYKYQPVNGPGTSKVQLSYQVFLLFPGLAKNYQNLARTERAIRCRLGFIDKYKSQDELCYVRCLGEGVDSGDVQSKYPSICGCKSTEGKSRCLDTRDRVADYGIVYKINPKSAVAEHIFMTEKQQVAFRAALAAAAAGAANASKVRR